MKKKNYITPSLKEHPFVHRRHLLSESVTNTGGNADLNYAGGGSGPARSRSADGNWE